MDNNDTILSGTYLNEDLVNHIITLCCQTGCTIQHNLFKTKKVSFIYDRYSENKRDSIQFNEVVIDPNQIINEPIIMYNREQPNDISRTILLKAFIQTDYCKIMVIKLMCKKLLRLSQCSITLYNIIQRHSIWNHLLYYCNTFLSAFKTVYIVPINFIFPYQEPLACLKNISIGSDILWEELKAILNFGKPSTTTTTLKRKVEPPKDKKRKPTVVKKPRKK